MGTKFENIIEIFKKEKDFILIGHTSPDGDSIASCFSLAMALNKLNKNVKVIMEDYHSKFDIIPGKEFLLEQEAVFTDETVLVCLDFGQRGRLDDNEYVINSSKKIVCIDHHVNNCDFEGEIYIIEGASSTSELVYNFIEQLVEIDKNIATAIYAGLVYDTGGFRHKSTTSKTYLIASKLLEFHIPFNEIYTNMIIKRTLKEAEMLSVGLKNVETFEEIKLIISSVSRLELIEHEASSKDFGGIVESILNTGENDVAVFLCEKGENFVKVNLRSKTVDVNKVASKFNGGGHKLASGCTIRDSLENAKKRLILEIQKEFDNYGKK